MEHLPRIDLSWRVSFWLNPEDNGVADTLPESLLLAIRRSRDYLFENHIRVYASKWSLTIDEENYVHFRLDILSQDTKTLNAMAGRIESNISPQSQITMIPTIG